MDNANVFANNKARGGASMDRPFRPLDGIRVVEMSHMIMGPSCGLFLAFLGAEVIKVEPPGGDKTRDLGGMGAAFFPLANRGKKSVELDLRTDAGRDALHKLLATADVFVENFRDSSLKGMGADLDELHKHYPRLIVASHKGFLHGPYQDRTAMDEVVQMMTGLAYMTGPTGRPLRVGSSANDIMAGLFGAVGVMGALMERDKTGEGRHLRIGLFENCLLLVAQHMIQFELTGHAAPPMPEREFSWPVYDIFDTADGRPIFVGAVTDGQWHSLCKLLGLDDLLNDPRLKTRMDQIEARDWTLPRIAAAIAEHDAADLARSFEELGIPFSPIARPEEMYDDPHVMRPGGLDTSRMSDGRSFRAPSLPFEVDGEMFSHAGDIAAIGQDTAAVLGGLGLSEAEIAAARGKKKAATA
jgi:crotonobetainyl-CoA:carnitine CoA-transferase CaiB-like acyl-CoA transferase